MNKERMSRSKSSRNEMLRELARLKEENKELNNTKAKEKMTLMRTFKTKNKLKRKS